MTPTNPDSRKYLLLTSGDFSKYVKKSLALTSEGKLSRLPKYRTLTAEHRRIQMDLVYHVLQELESQGKIEKVKTENVFMWKRKKKIAN